MTSSKPEPTRFPQSLSLMICYASRTGTRRNLDALRRYGWGLLVSRAGVDPAGMQRRTQAIRVPMISRFGESSYKLLSLGAFSEVLLHPAPLNGELPCSVQTDRRSGCSLTTERRSRENGATEVRCLASLFFAKQRTASASPQNCEVSATSQSSNRCFLKVKIAY